MYCNADIGELEGDVTQPTESKPGTIWIIGPACVGKTTLARLLVSHCRGEGRPAMLLDGDEIRQIHDTSLGYDPVSRRKQTARVQKLARWVQNQDILPVVAIIHPFQDDREACRDMFPGYFEVSLSCDMKERIRRDTKKLYLPALRGEKRHVIGVDIPFDDPVSADLVLETDQFEPQELLQTLLDATGL